MEPHEGTQPRQSHPMVEIFGCVICDKRFNKFNDLRRHKRSHNEKPFSCSKCEKKFNDFGALDSHDRAHTHDEETSQDALEAQKEIQTNEKPFKCKKCDNRFEHNNALQEHERIHTGDKPFHCDRCDKNFEAKSDLNVHKKSHQIVKPFRCSQCNKKFELQTSLAEHGPNCKNKLIDCNVISWNIGRGLMSNKKQIEEVLVGEDIGICFLIETDEEQQKLITVPCKENLSNYTIHTAKVVNPTDKVRIAALIRKDMKFKIREDIMDINISTVWIELLKNNSKNVLCGGVYREWNRPNPKQDAEVIIGQFQKATKENKPTVVLGDMNLNSKKWKKEDFDNKEIATMWLSGLAKNGLKFKDMGITWESTGIFNGEKRRSALDHIYYNNKDIFSNFRTIENSLSDHFKPILCTIKLNQPKQKAEVRYILRRKWSQFNDDNFLLDLRNKPWHEVMDPKKNANQQAIAFDEILESTVNTHAPLSKTKLRPNFKKGLSFKTKRLMRISENLRKQASKCKDQQLKAELSKKHHEARNKVKSNIRREDKLGVVKQMEESKNPSDYWKNVKNFDSNNNGEKIVLKEKVRLCENCEVKEKPFNCGQCDSTFRLKSDLTKHEKIHTGKEPLSCSKCDSNIDQRSELVEHEQIHTGEKPFSCSKCDSEFNQKSELVEHEQAHMEKPFSCPKCDSIFDQRSELAEHEQVHAREKRFSGSTCNHKLDQESELTEHEQVHMVEKPFNCSICDNKFNQKSELEEHEQIHTGEKPFSCSKCDNAFSQKSELVEHEKLHRCIACNNELQKNEKIIDNEEEVAEIFNEFFPEKVKTIESKIPAYNIDPTSKLKEKLNGRNLHFSFSQVTENEVKKAIKSIKSKSSSGVDFTSTKIIKLASEVIATPLCSIINNSLREGVFPN